MKKSIINKSCLAVVLAMGMGLGGSSFAAEPVIVASPNGKIKIEIKADEAGQLTWSVKRQDKVVLSPAPVGLTVDDKDLGKNPTLGQPVSKSIDEKYPVNGVHSVAINRCNELVIPVESNGVKYNLDVRAFDDGAAIRTRVTLDDADHNIAAESTSFAIPGRRGGVVDAV